MEKKKIKAEETLWEAKKKSIIAGSVIVVLLVLGMIGGILYKVYAGQGTVGGMLKIYYETMYSENGKSFNDLCNCLAPELQGNYFMDVTNGGADYSQLNKWRAEAMAEVGANVKVDVKVLEKTPATVGALGAIKEQLPYAEELAGVEFQVTLTGDDGFVKMKGYVACVREGDDWYLSTETVELGIVERSEAK
jgi:hypothetical protein